MEDPPNSNHATQAFEALETLEEHLNKLELAMDVQNLLGPWLGAGWVSSFRALSLRQVGCVYRCVDLCRFGLGPSALHVSKYLMHPQLQA